MGEKTRISFYDPGIYDQGLDDVTVESSAKMAANEVLDGKGRADYKTITGGSKNSV